MSKELVMVLVRLQLLEKLRAVRDWIRRRKRWRFWLGIIGAMPGLLYVALCVVISLLSPQDQGNLGVLMYFAYYSYMPWLLGGVLWAVFFMALEIWVIGQRQGRSEL